MSLLRDYDVAWPTLTVSMLSYSDVFNVGISIVAPQCFVAGYNFFVFYIATMAQPVRTCMLLGYCNPPGARAHITHGAQALALMLCGGIYLAASSAYRWLLRERGEGARPQRLCGLVQLSEVRRAKAVKFLRGVKGRCGMAGLWWAVL
jgi:hypothetical protein